MAEENKVSQRVLEIVRLKGPVIPTQISTEIGTSSLLASAILSELVSNSNLKISSVKIGGTPLYYAPGQEEKLQNYTKYLHEKETKAYELLKSKSVLRDKALEPVTRVALRQIKDFAAPLNVSTATGTELFWKWYLLSNEEAEPLIKQLLQIEEKPAQPTANLPNQQTLAPKPKKATRKSSDDFVKKILEYLSRNKIEVIEKIENKKKNEAEFVVAVPSPVGSIKYYSKAKDKKNCNEGDLSTAFVQGQNRKLPVLFLTTGKLTKKATEMLQKEFSTINVQKV